MKFSTVLVCGVFSVIQVPILFAQPLFDSADGIELRTANSVSVFSGKIQELTYEGSKPLKEFVRIKVEHTFKGKHERTKTIEFLSAGNASIAKDQHCLVFEGASENKLYLLNGSTKFMSRDFQTLTTNAEILKLVQESSVRFAGATNTNGFKLQVPKKYIKDPNWLKCYGSGGHVWVEVPVDSELEALAIDWIRSFTQEDADSIENFSQADQGLEAIRFFRSERNENLVRAVLQQDNLNESLRKIAQETWDYWGVDAE